MTVDGKTQRGTATGGNAAQHRLGAQLAADAIVITQIDVAAKTPATAATSRPPLPATPSG
ncbi:hypothetical protein ACQP1K_17715 [Sphaerimonospora sp. CA-214678]|uniref:hypothetical protein n=1 Tax=Sphaerimonospora sp. CA-214678 TaxID=3240029 RepID=UPI003D8B4E1F